MTLHLLKLCVGVESIEDLAHWQRQRLAAMKAAGQKAEIIHRTFQMPKRREELLDSGSLYWVIKGAVQARQALRDIREGRKDDGRPCAVLVLDRELVPVRPVPRRAFQGWRYLSADDAPPDLGAGGDANVAEMPAQMRRALAELGLI
ncbi:MAG: DUF1489 domain-containing protein [Hyphomicrobiaceae bacterium]